MLNFYLQSIGKLMEYKLVKLFFIIPLILILTSSAYAQSNISADTYRFNIANSNVVGITPDGTLIGSGADNVASAVTNIGFDFWLAGTKYTQFSVSENGLMKLGGTPISGSDVTNNMASATTLPKIAPYWDDLATGTNGSVTYQLTGTAPSRILYVNWNVTIPKNTAGAANATFQVKLYETGNIFFAFKNGVTLPANSAGYCIGIGKSTTDFASVQMTSTTAGTAYYGTSQNNTLGIAGGSYGRQFQFGTDNTAPTINSNNAISIPNAPGTANRTLSTVVADQAGVPVSGIPVPPSANVPRVYFKKNAETTWYSTAASLTTGNATSGTWLFTVDHSMIGGVTPGDQVSYFVIAQDNAEYKGSANIKSYPTGVEATDVNTCYYTTG